VPSACKDKLTTYESILSKYVYMKTLPSWKLARYLRNSQHSHPLINHSLQVMEQQIDNINNLLQSQLHYSQHVMCTIEPYSYQPIFIADRLLVQLGYVAKCVTNIQYACELGHVSACRLEHQLIDSP
jgi:hypothetical protein